MSDLVMPAQGTSGDSAFAQPSAAWHAPQRRSRWPWRLLILALLGSALLAGLALLTLDVVHWSAPVHLQIDGEEVFSGFNGRDLPPAHRVLLAAVVLMAVLAALLIVPLAVLLCVLAVLAALVVGIGLPLVVLLAALALLLSPLLLLGWVFWKLVS